MATFAENYKRRGLLDAFLGIEQDDPAPQQMPHEQQPTVEAIMQSLRPTNAQRRQSFWQALGDVGKALQEGRGLGAGVYDAGQRVAGVRDGVNQEALQKLKMQATLRQLMKPQYEAPKREKVTRTINNKPYEGYQQFNPKTGVYEDVADSFVEVKDPNSISPYQQAMLDAQNRRIDAMQNKPEKPDKGQVTTTQNGDLVIVDPISGSAKPVLDAAGNPVRGRVSGAPSAKQAQAAREKLQTVAILEKQLKNLKAAREKLSGAASGIVMGRNPINESGSNYDAALAALQTTIRQLTRTPGEGAMSDYESRMAQAQLPYRADYKSSIDQKISQIEDLANVIKSGYSGMIDVGMESNANDPATPAPQSAIEHLRNNPNLRDAFRQKYGYIPEGM